MAQPNKATNWVLQDPNGQPQMIKLVQPGGKPIGSLMTSTLSGQTIKIIKAQQPDHEGSQLSGTSGSRLLKLNSPTQLMNKVPMNSIRVAHSVEPQVQQKTFRLAPTQVQTMKIISPGSQKIQSAMQPIMQTPMPIIPKIEPKYASPPILDHSGNRKRQEMVDSDYAPEYKRRKTDKVGKGLRHFSMKVCEKVRRKGTTSYNEVADELVEEFTSSINSSATDQQYDQKNIRRRVYDALNVLMAMNIISKEKKEIRWLGLPTNSIQECIQLEKEKHSRIQSIKEKTKKLHDLLLNQIAYKNLSDRNKMFELEHGVPNPNSFIELPFVILNTNKKTIIECCISNDKSEYSFNFTDKFEIHDDSYVLKEIGMLMGIDRGECSPQNLEKIKHSIPKMLHDYIGHMASGVPDNLDILDMPSSPGPSSLLSSEDFGEEENSIQSSNFDPLSPCKDQDFSDEDGDMSDMSSDIDAN